LTLLKAKKVRASDTPFSIMVLNCSSWPGRPSWAVSVQEAAAKVKSSKPASAPASPGMRSGSTKSGVSPVLPMIRAGETLGAGVAALSAALASRTRIWRSGMVTMRASRISFSRSRTRCW
jgi:hypothetical protein